MIEVDPATGRIQLRDTVRREAPAYGLASAAQALAAEKEAAWPALESLLPARPGAPPKITYYLYSTIDRKIDELRAMRRTLADLAERCHGDDLPECPILDDLAGGSISLSNS